MPWVPFTASDVTNRLSDLEVTGYEEVANDAVGATKLNSIVAQITAMIRGAVLANPNRPFIGPTGTIPDLSLYHAATLGVNALLGLPPVAEGHTDPRRDGQREALKHVAELRALDARAFEEAPSNGDSICGSSGGEPLIEF